MKFDPLDVLAGANDSDLHPALFWMYAFASETYVSDKRSESGAVLHGLAELSADMFSDDVPSFPILILDDPVASDTDGRVEPSLGDSMPPSAY